MYIELKNVNKIKVYQYFVTSVLAGEFLNLEIS